MNYRGWTVTLNDSRCYTTAVASIIWMILCCMLTLSSRWQCCVSLQSFLSRTELLSANGGLSAVQKHTTVSLLCRGSNIFLCYFHINSAAPTCLSFLSHSNLEYIAALSDTMLRLGLRVKAPLFFPHISVVMKRFHRYFLTSSHISL